MTNLLTAQDFWSAPTGDVLLYAPNFPEPMGRTVRVYAANIDATHHHYTYPLKIFALWLGDRASAAGMTSDVARDQLGPLFMEFVENQHGGVFKESLKVSAEAHARSVYVTLWSTYETFIRAFVGGLYNSFPDVVPDVKEKERTSAVGRLGTYLTSKKINYKTLLERLRKTDVVKSGQPSLDEALQHRWLKRLEARRHAVVHKAGIIDEEYVADLQEDAVGDKVPVSPNDVRNCFAAVHNVAFNLCADVTGYIMRRHPDVAEQLHALALAQRRASL